MVESRQQLVFERFEDNTHELLIGAYFPGYLAPPNTRMVRVYSKDRYVIGLGGRRGNVRRATGREWNAAAPLLQFHSSAWEPNSGRRPGTWDDDITDDLKLEHKGRLFPKSGRHWSLPRNASRLSEDGSLLAVSSWEGHDKMVGLIGHPMLSAPVFSGFVYVDVYRVETTERVLAIRAEVKSVPSEYSLLQNYYWAGKRFLIWELDANSGMGHETTPKYLICDTASLDH